MSLDPRQSPPFALLVIHGAARCSIPGARGDGLPQYPTELKRDRGLVLSARTGLNSGEALVGKIGDDLRMEHTEQAHTVNPTERMEQLAGPVKVYLAGATRSPPEGYVDLEDLGKLRIHGAGDAVPVLEQELSS